MDRPHFVPFAITSVSDFMKALFTQAAAEARATASHRIGAGERTIHTLHRQIERQRARTFGRGRYDWNKH